MQHIIYSAGVLGKGGRPSFIVVVAGPSGPSRYRRQDKFSKRYTSGHEQLRIGSGLRSGVSGKAPIRPSGVFFGLSNLGERRHGSGDAHLASTPPVNLDCVCPIAFDGAIYFVAAGGSGNELWRAKPGGVDTQVLDINGTHLFRVADAATGSELRMSDVTAAGTVLLKDLNPGGASSTPVPFRVLYGVLVFRAFEPATGIEVWKTGGSAAGTTIVKDIKPGAANSIPTRFIIHDNVIYLTAADDSTGAELWKTDGSAAGSFLVKDINPGTVRSSPTLITNSNGALFFSASLTATGTELWRSDGSTVGTVLFTDINSSPSSSTPIILTNVNGTLFFSAPDSTFSRRLWNSDRTEAGT
ncbi:MAG: hypothetical protein O2968_15370 [Acidobacteria bacterium]|nr:hypothetical protein [Acidobacteriota bacterium]